MDLPNELVRRGLHPDGCKALAEHAAQLARALPVLVEALGRAGFTTPVCVGDGSVALWWDRIKHYALRDGEPATFGLVLLVASAEGGHAQLVVLPLWLAKIDNSAAIRCDSIEHAPRSMLPLLASLLPALLDRLAEVAGAAERMAKALAVVQKEP